MPRWTVHFDTYVNAYDPEIIELVARIKALASVIRSIPIPPHVQQRLDRLNIMRAVRGTTGIEGTDLSEEEVAEVLDAPPSKQVLSDARQREEQEVKNAAALMYSVAARLTEKPDSPVTEALICAIHRVVTQDIEYPNNVPGQYRTFPVRAGDYSPPAGGDEIRNLMAEFVKWLNSGLATEWDPVIRAIVAHFYLISIHPFGDGNGRASRALESYLLFQARVNARGFYSLANYYYRHRAEYVAWLDHVRFRSDPDLTPFVVFALRGLVQELELVYGEVLNEVQIISFRDFARETLDTHNKLGTPVGERQLLFLVTLERDPVSLRALRSGKHPLSQLYVGVTNKTLMRDIHFFRDNKLILISGDELRANLDIMKQFTAVGPADPAGLGQYERSEPGRTLHDRGVELAGTSTKSSG